MEQEILNTVVLIFAHGEIIPEVVTLTSDSISKMSYQTYHENIQKNASNKESDLDDIFSGIDLSTFDLDSILPPPDKKQRIGGTKKRYREDSSSKFINNRLTKKSFSYT